MDFNWDQIEAYNRAVEDEDEREECEKISPQYMNKHMPTIMSLAAQGHTKSAVARVLGVSTQRVQALAKKNNVRFSIDNAKNLNWKKMTYRVGVFARQGCTPKEVASILNISAQEVMDFAIENRIVFREQPNVIRELLG